MILNRVNLPLLSLTSLLFASTLSLKSVKALGYRWCKLSISGYGLWHDFMSSQIKNPRWMYWFQNLLSSFRCSFYYTLSYSCIIFYAIFELLPCTYSVFLVFDFSASSAFFFFLFDYIDLGLLTYRHVSFYFLSGHVHPRSPKFSS
jgi:hypothetical protein